MEGKKQCPEFPYFGAKYPDARCIDGYLWDLDKCEGDKLYGGGEVPCPFCNSEEFIEYHVGDDITAERVDSHVVFLKRKYNYTENHKQDKQ
jgi:hypothetical protein